MFRCFKSSGMKYNGELLPVTQLYKFFITQSNLGTKGWNLPLVVPLARIAKYKQCFGRHEVNLFPPKIFQLPVRLLSVAASLR